MGWKCFLLPTRPTFGSVDYRPGAMWFAGEEAEFPNDWAWIPSQAFKASGRRPLLVLLPSYQTTWKDDNGIEHPKKHCEVFCVDQAPTDHPESGGWTYTGEPPNITLSPSINCVGRYHGFIQNGIITPCVEGKKFPHWPEDA